MSSSSNVTIHRKRKYAESISDAEYFTADDEERVTSSRDVELASPARKRSLNSLRTSESSTCDDIPQSPKRTAKSTTLVSSSSTVISLASSSLSLLLFSSCPISQPSSIFSVAAKSSKKIPAQLPSTSTSSSEVVSDTEALNVDSKKRIEEASKSNLRSSRSTTSLLSQTDLTAPSELVFRKLRPRSPQKKSSTEPLRPFASVGSLLSSVPKFNPLPIKSRTTTTKMSNPPAKAESFADRSNNQDKRQITFRKATNAHLNVSLSWKASASHRSCDNDSAQLTRKMTLMPKSVRMNNQKSKKRVSFGRLKVYYFDRTQGFDTVPTSGSVALGMERHHHTVKDYSFFEFNKANSLEQIRKCARWLRAANMEIASRSSSISSRAATVPAESPSSQEQISAEPIASYSNETTDELNNNFVDTLAVVSCASQSTTSNESLACHAGSSLSGSSQPGDDANICQFNNPVIVDADNSDTPNLDETFPYRDGRPIFGDLCATSDADTSQSSSQQPIGQHSAFNEYRFIVDGDIEQEDADGDALPGSPVSSAYSSDEDVTNEFKQLEYQFVPIRSRIRRTILQNSGVEIDTSVRDEYREIARSRSVVGCDCAGVCETLTCACAQLGVGCQVDRPSFPCSCTSKDSCHNPEGRIEFDPEQVHSHYLHSMMRLRIIQKHGLEDSPLSNSPTRIKFLDDASTEDIVPKTDTCNETDA